jgi:hypothetical protein
MVGRRGSSRLGRMSRSVSRVLLRWRGGGATLAFTDESQKIRFKSRPVLRGMAQQQFDEPAFSRTEVPLYPTPCEAMQECNRLLGKQLFEFFGGHLGPVIRETSIVNR